MSVSNRYICQFSDFVTHTKLHQQRVFLLGMWLYKKHPEQFGEISWDVASGFLQLHDQAKFSPRIQASTSGLGLTYLEVLYEFYGKRAADEKLEISRMKTILEMNQLEKDIGDRYIDRQCRNWPTEAAILSEKLRRLESLSDLVDRGLCPVSHEEFGYELVKASDFLKETHLQELAFEMETHYAQIIGPWSYGQYVKSRNAS